MKDLKNEMEESNTEKEKCSRFFYNSNSNSCNEVCKKITVNSVEFTQCMNDCRHCCQVVGGECK